MPRLRSQSLKTETRLRRSEKHLKNEVFEIETTTLVPSTEMYRVSQKNVDPLRVSSIFSLGLSLFA